jgi:hypothetical protein
VKSHLDRDPLPPLTIPGVYLRMLEGDTGFMTKDEVVPEASLNPTISLPCETCQVPLHQRRTCYRDPYARRMRWYATSGLQQRTTL